MRAVGPLICILAATAHATVYDTYGFGPRAVAMFVDSHCHLNFPDFHGRLPEILSAMAAARVGRALCICTTLEEFDSVQQIALNHDNIWCSAGVHPDNEGVSEPTVDDLLE